MVRRYEFFLLVGSGSVPLRQRKIKRFPLFLSRFGRSYVTDFISPTKLKKLKNKKQKTKQTFKTLKTLKTPLKTPKHVKRERRKGRSRIPLSNFFFSAPPLTPLTSSNSEGDPVQVELGGAQNKMSPEMSSSTGSFSAGFLKDTFCGSSTLAFFIKVSQCLSKVFAFRLV